MITFFAVVVAGGAVFAAPYLGSRVYHAAASLPVASTFRAFGTASVAVDTRSDVASHSPQRAIAAPYNAQHRGVGRATRGEAQARKVPRGVHRRGVPWAELDKQRARFAALIHGGAR